MLEHQTGIGLPDAPLISQPIEQCIQVGGRRHLGPQSEVEGAGEVETLDHTVVIGNQRNQRCSFSIVIEPHVDCGLHRPTQLGVVEHGSKARDHAAVDEPLHARPGGIWAEPDSLAEFPMTHPTVDLQNTEDFSVNVINHSAIHTSKPISTEYSVPHTGTSPS